MNSVKLSNLDNNPLLVEIADEEATTLNGGKLPWGAIISVGATVVQIAYDLWKNRKKK
jgi:hypothetical protein